MQPECSLLMEHVKKGELFYLPRKNCFQTLCYCCEMQHMLSRIAVRNPLHIDELFGEACTHLFDKSGVANTCGKSAVGGSAEAFAFRQAAVRLVGRPDC